MNSLVVVKSPQDTRTVNVDFADRLTNGEFIQSAALYTVDTDNLTYTMGPLQGSLIPITVSLGQDNQTYGVQVTVNTSQGHVYSKVVAVVTNSQLALKHQNRNVNAFNDLVGEIEAGESAIGTVSFTFPSPFKAEHGVVTWALIDRDGVTYGHGTAYSYSIEYLTSDTKVSAQAVIQTPEDMLPTLSGQNYQIRWTLHVKGETYYSFESLKVNGTNTVPLGVEDVVELQFNDIPVRVSFQDPYENVSFELYKGNELVVPAVPVSQSFHTPDGYMYQGALTQVQLPADLEAYSIVWSGWNTGSEILKERQIGRVFIINPSIMAATEDMRILINKARTSAFHEPDILFSVPLLLAYLRRGRDAFNGAFGVLTGFTMLNASGSLREYWLRYSEVLALRAQFLAEGEKVFNFAGQAISLDVDRTQYYSQLADNLQQLLDNEVKPYKQNLTIKGILAGDGNLGADGGSSSRFGALGAVGITLTPATGWGKYAARFGIRR